jgi:homoserine kinase
MPERLAFRVPGSTTNLGHGFDCLGIALGLANTVTVEAGGAAASAPGSADPGLAPMAERVRSECAAAWGRAVPGFAVTVRGDVPIARGMGSSATILLGVAAACRRLAGLDDDAGAVLEVAARIEGHPDNVAAACLGGFTVVGEHGGRLRWTRFAVPAELMAVVAIPPFEVKTSEARRILPQELPRRDAVQALQRTALITAALAQGRPEELRGLFDEAWHERHRAALNPGLAEARAAASATGAYGTILSGSGSTVLSFVARDRAEPVRAAVERSYAERGVQARVIAVGFDNTGLSAIPPTSMTA